MKWLIAGAAAIWLLVSALRSFHRLPPPVRRVLAPLERRVRASATRWGRAAYVALAVTAAYVIVSRILFSLT